MQRPSHTGAIALAAVCLGTGPAKGAVMVGKVVSYTYLWPDSTVLYGPTNATVGAAVEYSDPHGGYFSVDLTDANILVDFFNSATFGNPPTFNGFRIQDVNGTISDFTSATLGPATNMVGLDASRITFDADNIYVNWKGLSFNSNTIVSVNVTAVPEPSAVLLGAFGVVGLLRRRRTA